jgi:uncharacterized FlgJ-related protein|tara:strand:+ start:461 stop:1045 length:585 start_codon:yes stop_codon:yes gene_type:complete
MFYTYCKKSLSFKKFQFKKLIPPFLIICGIFSLIYQTQITNAKDQGFNEGSKIPYETEVFAIESTTDSFSQDELVKELKRLNVRFPEIILAQSILETGHFSSRIFKENNNLFGMKQARARSTTAVGTQLGHAYYDNWKQSVMDYALFQNAYMNKLRKQKQYLNYLDKNYAEAENYDKVLLQVIERERLKELFLD